MTDTSYNDGKWHGWGGGKVIHVREVIGDDT